MFRFSEKITNNEAFQSILLLLIIHIVWTSWVLSGLSEITKKKLLCVDKHHFNV